MALTKRLHFHGRLTTAEEVAGEQTAAVSCTAADPFWFLMRRHIGKSQTGYSKGTAAAPVETGSIIVDMLTATNAEGPTGLAAGNLQPAGSTYVKDWFYKKIGEGTAELCATLDGPEFLVRAQEYAGGYYGKLDLSPALGTIQGRAAFEYGDGLRNVKGYTRIASLEGAANRVFHLPPGFPDNATQTVLVAEDAAAIAAGGLLEDVLTVDLSPDELRQKLLAYHIAARARGRQTITFSPSQNPDSRWTFVLTDLAGRELGELTGASGKRLALPISSMATAAFAVPLDHPWADYLIDSASIDASTGALVKVYEERDDPVPDAELPTFGVHYDRGDVVPFRSSAWRNGRLEKRINIWARVYQAEITVDPGGAATPALTLVPQ